MKGDLVRVKHMMDAAQEILDYMSDKKKEDLHRNRMLSLAVVRLLEIIGEAANKVTPGFQKKYPNVPWRFIIGTRNRLINGYYDIDLDVVWETVTKDIPQLQKELEHALQREYRNKARHEE